MLLFVTASFNNSHIHVSNKLRQMHTVFICNSDTSAPVWTSDMFHSHRTDLQAVISLNALFSAHKHTYIYLSIRTYTYVFMYVRTYIHTYKHT